jgi:carboxypeptidase-like protein
MRHGAPMRPIVPILALLLLGAYSLAAEDFSGTVTDDRRDPVGFATVVLLELDFVETTDEDGTFVFRDVDSGSYTLLVIAPGYLELETIVSIPADEFLIVLTPETVEMDTIVVIADESLPEEVLDNEVSAEELERLPPRSNPFDALLQESGILADLGGGFDGPNDGDGGPAAGEEVPGSVTISIEGGTIGRVNSNRRDGISVYGGESDWNNYFYDYIRIPTNTHAFGYPEPDAIVPVEAVDEIGIHKGVIPVEYGPAIGGLFTMEPTTKTEQFEFTFTPSIMDVSLLTRWSLTDDLSLLLSANQSIVQYTLLPIVGLLVQAQSEDDVNEEGDPTSFAYGDALLRLLYSPPRHSLSLDFLAYYDRWLFDISFEDFILYSKYGPYYLAAGSNWNYSPSSQLSNSLYAFGSYYSDFGNYDFRFPTTIVFDPEDETEPDAFYDIHFDWLSRVSSVQAGNELIWNVLPSTSLLLGLNGRLANMDGDYTEIIIQTDPVGTELSNETLVLPGIDELFLSTYGYGKVLGQTGPVKYNAGVGMLWFPGAMVVRPSVSGELLYLGDGMVAALGAGWSPGIINEFSYIDRRLDEQYYELDSTTELYNPPMAVSVASQVVWPVSEKHSLGVAPYFAWYYDLSGISVSTSGSDPDGAFISYDPTDGYSTGIDLNWEATLSERWELDLSYAFSWTRYLTEEWGWVAPNSEVRNAVKSGLLYRGDRLRVGQNLLVYSGTPFTPEVVTQDELGVIGISQGDYNSAMDYVPKIDIRTNLSYDWDFDRFDMSFFYNSSNWLDAANGSLIGIDPDLQDVPGTSSATFGNREYAYSFDWTDFLVNLLLSDFGLSFSF